MKNISEGELEAMREKAYEHTESVDQEFEDRIDRLVTVDVSISSHEKSWLRDLIYQAFQEGYLTRMEEEDGHTHTS